MDIQLSAGALTAVGGILTVLTGTISVLFWALIAELRRSRDRAEDQVDTILPALEKLTGALEASNTLRSELRREQQR